MKTLGLVLGLLAASTGTAAAMGSDVSVDLVAWNRDGSAAVLATHTFRDGDRSTRYSIVAVGAKPVEAAVSQTTRDSGRDDEQIGLAACKQATAQLAAALTAHHFDGVVAKSARCSDAKRDIVVVTAAVSDAADRSWVALPQGRSPTARELASWNAAKSVTPAYQPLGLSPGDACDKQTDTLDVANKSGKLILVFASWRCNSPIKTIVHRFVPAGSPGTYVEAT